MIISQIPRGQAFESLVDTDEELMLLNSTDTCMLDKFKMEQVVRNLVSNALKFSPNGSTVTVSAYFVPSITGEEWYHEGSHNHKDRAGAMSSGGRHLARRRRLHQNHKRGGNVSSVISSVSNIIHNTTRRMSGTTFPYIPYLWVACRHIFIPFSSLFHPFFTPFSSLFLPSLPLTFVRT